MKTFESARAKCQKEKDKHLKLKEDLNSITERLFNGDEASFDDNELRLLKDLKVHVTLKSIVGDESMPTAIVKLRERISIVRDRPFSTLKTYLMHKGCDRSDVLDYLCNDVVQQYSLSDVGETNSLTVDNEKESLCVDALVSLGAAI